MLLVRGVLRHCVIDFPSCCHCCLQTARKIHVAKFRAGKVGVLITTDVAARGIDIPLIDNVINYDFPAKPELFVHR
jgi:superfamily II DNA/RNA helicase